MKATVITSCEELAEHEERWEALRGECGGTIFSSPLTVRTWLEAYCALSKPRAIIVEDNGDLVGIAPLATHRLTLAGLPVRVLALAGEVHHRLWLMTNSVLWSPGRRDVLELMLAEMRKMDWSLLTAVHMEDTPAVREFVGEVGERWHSEGCYIGSSLAIPIPESGEIIDLFGKNARKNVRQSLRDAERNGMSPNFRRLRPDEVGPAVDVYVRQHRERWASRGGSMFDLEDNVRFLRTVIERACAEGHGFAYELRLGDEIAAQNFGFVDGDKAYSYRTGMNDALMRYSPGWLMKMYGLEAARESGVRKFVLGLGAEEHKFRMGGEETHLVCARVTRGLLSSMMRVVSSPPVRYLDSKLNLTGRFADRAEN